MESHDLLHLTFAVVTLLGWLLAYSILSKSQREATDAAVQRVHDWLSQIDSWESLVSGSLSITRRLLPIAYGGGGCTGLALFSVVHTIVGLGAAWYLIEDKPELYSLREKLEEQADPVLFSAAAGGSFEYLYRKKVVGQATALGYPVNIKEYTHNEPVHQHLRDRLASYDSGLVRLQRSTQRDPRLFLVWLRDGTKVTPGFNFRGIAAVVLYNFLFCLVTVLAVGSVLEVQEKSRSAFTNLLTLFGTGVIASALFGLNLAMFNSLSLSTGSYFWRNLVVLPATGVGILAVFSIGCIIMLMGVLGVRELGCCVIVPLLSGLLWICLTIYFADRLAVSDAIALLYWEGVPSLVTARGDLNWTPYFLASTSLLPLILAGAVVCLLACLASLADGLRLTVVYYLRGVINSPGATLFSIVATPLLIIEFLGLVFKVLTPFLK